MSTPADSQDPGSGIGWYNAETGEWDKYEPNMSSTAPTQPLLPYAGTSGYAGSETSENRAREADADGTTRDRQRRTLREVSDHGAYGLTVKELREITGWHHGQASSVLSVLHKEGMLARLKYTRDRCKVYVRQSFVQGREVEPPGRVANATKIAVVAERARIVAALKEQIAADPHYIPRRDAFEKAIEIVEGS